MSSEDKKRIKRLATAVCRSLRDATPEESSENKSKDISDMAAFWAANWQYFNSLNIPASLSTSTWPDSTDSYDSFSIPAPTFSGAPLSASTWPSSTNGYRYNIGYGYGHNAEAVPSPTFQVSRTTNGANFEGFPRIAITAIS